MYLPRLFSIVLYACLGETTIPLVSWAWGAFGISCTKKNHYNFASRCCEERQSYFYTKLDHEMLRDYFDGNLWRSDLFRIRSGFCQSDAIRSRFCQSGPIRSGFCQSDPIRSGPDFVNTRSAVPLERNRHTPKVALSGCAVSLHSWNNFLFWTLTCFWSLNLVIWGLALEPGLCGCCPFHWGPDCLFPWTLWTSICSGLPLNSGRM